MRNESGPSSGKAAKNNRPLTGFPEHPTAKLPGCEMYPEVMIDHKIHEGLRGIVYQAESDSHMLVVRTFRITGGEENPEFREEFLGDARKLKALDHPNLVRTFGGGSFANGDCYMVAEFVERPTLHELVKDKGIVWERLAVQIIRDVADALRVAKQSGLSHGNLKPENILLESKPLPVPKDHFAYIVKVADLGLEKYMPRWTTEEGIPEEPERAETLVYRAPECWEKGVSSTSEKADIYSLGGVLYYLLVGRAPFSTNNLNDFLATKRNEAPSPRSQVINLDERVKRLCREMMAPNPDDRPADLETVIQRCDMIVEALPTKKQMRHTDVYVHRSLSRALLVSIVAVIVILTLLLTVGYYELTKEPSAAEGGAGPENVDEILDEMVIPEE